MLDIAVLTCKKLLTPDPRDFHVSQVIYEESLLLDYFNRQGIKAARIDWRTSTLDWSTVGCAVFRSTWDYHDQPELFSAWLGHVKSRTRLVNPHPVIEWNLDKRYLERLEAAGVDIVPTCFLEPQDRIDLDVLHSSMESDDLVIKPLVSASGAETYRVSRTTGPEVQPEVVELLRTKPVLVQPFQEKILSEGELSFVVIDGICTHAAKKIAAPGEFRVQDDHGGYALPYRASKSEREFAQGVANACPGPLNYARIDVVRGEKDRLLVMEVELFEPELFFRFNRAAAETLAESLLR